MASQQYGLGRGLASLIPPKKGDGSGASPFVITPASQGNGPVDDGRVFPSSSPVPVAAGTPNADSALKEIPLASIVPNPHQPRLHFDEAKLEELVSSIKEHGILQPLRRDQKRRTV